VTPLEDHLKAFELNLKKNTPKHVKLTMSRIRRLVSECGFESLADLTSESVENSLREMLEENEIGHRTYSHYVQALDSFCNWCVETHRLIVSPIIGLERLNAEVDVRHRRRALKPDEFRKLIRSAFTSDIDIQCFSGPERAKIYILSYPTGLRRKEIASLTPRSFDLDSVPATVTIEAACSKHRREDVLRLHPALITMLREWTDGKDPDELLFPKLANRRAWLMVKKDLERVGIPYETPDGIADVHAAGRHTHITELFRNGASVQEARQLARHSDIRQTMKYAHIGIEDQARAVGAPPPGERRC
jgi:integrase